MDRFSIINADLRKRAISAVSSESSRTNPLASFGQNEWLVDELYQKYLQDPESVDKAWWNFFADYNPDYGPGRTPAREAANGTATAPAPTAPKAAVTTTATEKPKVSTPVPAGAEEVKLRGAAARTAANMDSSLTVPTATSVRAIPAKLLIDNRIVINNHLARGRGGKVSFTHLIGYAIVKALKAMPEMNYSYTEVEGKPTLVKPEHIGFGLAIDVQKSSGERQLLVPSIKAAEGMDFRQFWMAYEDIVRKARSGKLGVDDFSGTTISLTNPGTIGTVHSVPRLMPGQGTIIGVGAMEYPAEYQGASPDTLSRLAVSKVMTLTSTYDHRIIQGAQSGDFLRTIHRLLLGEDGFYDEIFEALRIPYEPVRWTQDVSASHDDDVAKSARVIELIHAYRVRGHLMAETDPLEYKQRKHPDLDIQSHGLTLWDLEREFATGGFGGRPLMKLREILGVLRDSYCRTVGIEYMHIQNPEERALDPGAGGEGARQARPRGAAARPRAPQHGGGVRDLPADEVRRPEEVLPGGRRVPHPAARLGHQRGSRRGPRRGRHRHGPPRQAQRAGQHRGQVLRPDLRRVRGQHRPAHGARLR
ncbi:hypothetical protein GCM10020219_088270 [Nonomuraea dietziae]